MLAKRIITVFFLCLSWAGLVFAKPTTIIAFGDSLTAGYGLPEHQSFPNQLHKKLKQKNYDVKVINAGVSGDTTQSALARIEWVMQDIPKDHPTVVMVALGANDMLRGIDPQLSYKNLHAIITRLLTKNVKILLVGMRADPSIGLEYGEKFDAIYPKIMAEFQKTQAISLYPFFLKGVAGLKSLNQHDGMHPNTHGVAIMVDNILPAIEKLLL